MLKRQKGVGVERKAKQDVNIALAGVEIEFTGQGVGQNTNSGEDQFILLLL